MNVGVLRGAGKLKGFASSWTLDERLQHERHPFDGKTPVTPLMPKTSFPARILRMVAAPITLLIPGEGPPPTKIAIAPEFSFL